MSSSPDDLTARARIRDAALAEFAEHGEKGATVRSIALSAGVSPALVQHHYRTKAGLRAACDAYVLAYVRQGVAEGIDEGGIADPAFTVETLRTGPPVVRYLGRSLVDGSPGSAEIFDRIVALSQPYLHSQDDTIDPTARAAVLVAMRLGLVVLHEHLSRNLGVDVFSPVGTRLNARIQLELLNPALTDPSIFEHARTGLDASAGTTLPSRTPNHEE